MSKVDILCTDPEHPVWPWLRQWKVEHPQCSVSLLTDCNQAGGGDFLFLVSCQQLISKPCRERYRYTLVLHASDLPKGRGMSPHIWQVLEGRQRILVSLLNAEDSIDTGAIWQQYAFDLEGHELSTEINAKLFDCELRLMDWAVHHCDGAEPQEQRGEPSLYPRRGPEDSRLDPGQSLQEQFNLLRVVDNQRYPAFFEWAGHRYKLTIEKDDV